MRRIRNETNYKLVLCTSTMETIVVSRGINIEVLILVLVLPLVLHLGAPLEALWVKVPLVLGSFKVLLN